MSHYTNEEIIATRDRLRMRAKTYPVRHRTRTMIVTASEMIDQLLTSMETSAATNLTPAAVKSYLKKHGLKLTKKQAEIFGLKP